MSILKLIIQIDPGGLFLFYHVDINHFIVILSIKFHFAEFSLIKPTNIRIIYPYRFI